jgi:hypothetical protein
MPGLTVTVILQDLKKLETEAVIAGFYEDVRPLKGLAGQLDWLLCGSLSSLIIHNKLRGSLGDAALVTSRGKVSAQKIFMIGLGPRERLSPSTLRSAFRNAVSTAIGAGVKSIAIECFQAPQMSSDEVMRVLQTGFAEGANGRGIDIVVLAPDSASYERMSEQVKGSSPQPRGFTSGTQPTLAG